MSRARIVAAVLGAAVVVAGAITDGLWPAEAAPGPAETILAGSAVQFASHTRPTGEVPGSERLTIQLWLKPDLAAAQRFSVGVSTPGSPSFRHYLSPAQYTARFAAGAPAVRQTESWLRAQGFTGIAADSGRSYVRATAPVSKINAAFRVRLMTYPGSASAHAASGELHANDRAVSLPVSLAGHVVAVTGLDNAEPIFPLEALAGTARTVTMRADSSVNARGPKAPCSRYYGQHRTRGLPAHFGITSFPTFVCGYSARQMRSAYGADWTSTGKGQTIALVEQGLTRNMFLTLRDYAKANRMPAPSARRYAQLSLGSDSCGDPFDLEEQLDVEASYDMAPAAHQIVVAGDSCNQAEEGLQALYDADIMVLDGAAGHPLATVASNSWGVGTAYVPASQVNLVHAYLVRAAAEGVGMYFSAGDGSGNIEPSVDPDAISVGGTTLGIGRSGRRLFETGWSTGISQLEGTTWHLRGEDGASGGGASKRAQPAYQAGVVPRSLATTRVAPDIAADADPFTGIDVGLLRFGGGRARFLEESIGGTSESSPLIAGMVAAAQQGQAAPFGFINPAIYQLNRTSAFYDTLPLTASSPPLYRGVECDLLEFDNICLGPGTRNNRIPSLTTFDDQSRGMAGYTGQVTLPGYDTMTGLGVPNGQVFIADLRRLG